MPHNQSSYSQVVYITANGDEIILSGNGTRFRWELYGRSGFRAPDLKTESRVYANGISRTLASILQKRVVTLQMVITGPSRAEAAAIYNSLVSRLVQTGARDQWGKLVLTRDDDGSTVYLDCLYTGGMNISEDYPKIFFFSLNFEAGDPYFYDLEETVLEPSRLESLIYLDDTLFLGDWTLLDGLTSVEIDNTGEQFYPVFEITGPASVIRVTNEATGQTVAMGDDFSLVTGQTLTIDCRENLRGITLTENGEETDITHRLALGSSLVFPLVKGTNTLQFYYTDIDETSSFKIRYRQRYHSA